MKFVEESDPGFTAINIGTGSGTSVYEVLEMIQDVTGISIEPIVGQRREGDPPALVADVGLAKEILGWQSSRDLREIVSSAWDAWQLGHK
jgi:UDP-glucose 4-epimerase